jgi:hypothetical protein
MVDLGSRTSAESAEVTGGFLVEWWRQAHAAGIDLLPTLPSVARRSLPMLDERPRQG